MRSSTQLEPRGSFTSAGTTPTQPGWTCGHDTFFEQFVLSSSWGLVPPREWWPSASSPFSWRGEKIYTSATFWKSLQILRILRPQTAGSPELTCSALGPSADVPAVPTFPRAAAGVRLWSSRFVSSCLNVEWLRWYEDYVKMPNNWEYDFHDFVVQ